MAQQQNQQAMFPPRYSGCIRQQQQIMAEATAGKISLTNDNDGNINGDRYQQFAARPTKQRPEPPMMTISDRYPTCEQDVRVNVLFSITNIGRLYMSC